MAERENLAKYECCDTTWVGPFHDGERCFFCDSIVVARNAHVMAVSPKVDTNVTPEEVSLYLGGLGNFAPYV